MLISIFLIFFASGFCGLSYEIVWTRYLASIFGGAQTAFSSVLANFIFGLAAGSLSFSQIAKRMNPLRLYSICEAGIGLWALVFPIFIRGVDYLIQNRVDFFSTIKFSFFAIFFPCFLMGGTLPILSSLSTRIKFVAFLYGANTGGAVLGTLISGLLLIEMLGLDTLSRVLGVVNILLSLISLLLSFIYKKETEEGTAADNRKNVLSPLIFTFVAGFATFGYQIIFSRFFQIVLGSSVYAITLILIVFIAFISIGSFIWGKYLSRYNQFTIFGLFQGISAFFIIFDLYIINRIPYYFVLISSSIERAEHTFPIYLLSIFLFLSVFVCIPAFCSGISFPSCISIFGGKDLEKGTGYIFSLNSLGNIVGALLTAFVIIPLYGFRNSLIIISTSNIVISSSSLFKRIRYFSFIPIIFFFVFTGLAPAIENSLFVLGAHRLSPAPPSVLKNFENFKESFKDKKILFFENDENISCAVYTSPAYDGRVIQKTLTVNGKPDASSFGDMKTQILLGNIGCFFLDKFGNALVVGLGSGITLSNILSFPFRSVDVVEISRCVVKASDYFSEFNNNSLKDTRVSLYLEDAQTFVRRTKKKYDIVVSEPSNPWLRGVGNLFSIEFFNDVYPLISDDGVFVQWFHTYEMDDKTFDVVISSISKVFKNLLIFEPQGGDIIIIASKKSLMNKLENIFPAFYYPNVRRNLEHISFLTPFTLAFLRQVELNTDTQEGELNSKFHPLLEFRAARASWRKTRAQLNFTDEFLKLFTEKFGYYESDITQSAIFFADPKSSFLDRFCSTYTLGLTTGTPLDANFHKYVLNCVLAYGGPDVNKFYQKRDFRTLLSYIVENKDFFMAVWRSPKI